MKAVRIESYSKEIKTTLCEIPVPEIGDNEVLVKVAVAAVNPLDLLNLTGSVKLIQDYAMPLTLGNELTGTIERLGRSVTGFQAGDRIYTRLPLEKIGAFAEYVAVDAGAIWHLPRNLDLVTGAGAALTGLTAYQGLKEELNAQPGQTVLITGGSGSFGQMAVPLAKTMGLRVIVSGNPAARERTLATGAERYIDYTKENYWERSEPVDFVIDTLGAKEIERELSVIKSGGRLLSLRAGPNKRFAQDRGLPFLKQQLFAAAGAKLDGMAKKQGVEYHFIFVRSDGKQLREITKLIEDNNIVPAIDPTEFSLEQANEALSFVATGHLRGKVVIKL